MMKPNSTKRPPRAISRRVLASGALGALSLGMATESGRAGFTHATWGRHEHSWIPGVEIEVCTLCGKTRPKQDPAQTSGS